MLPYCHMHLYQPFRLAATEFLAKFLFVEWACNGVRINQPGGIGRCTSVQKKKRVIKVVPAMAFFTIPDYPSFFVWRMQSAIIDTNGITSKIIPPVPYKLESAP